MPPPDRRVVQRADLDAGGPLADRARPGGHQTVEPCHQSGADQRHPDDHGGVRVHPRHPVAHRAGAVVHREVQSDTHRARDDAQPERHRETRRSLEPGPDALPPYPVGGHRALCLRQVKPGLVGQVRGLLHRQAAVHLDPELGARRHQIGQRAPAGRVAPRRTSAVTDRATRRTRCARPARWRRRSTAPWAACPGSSARRRSARRAARAR